jgi:hypothetical protein
MTKIRTLIFIIFFLTINAYCQSGDPVEMADILRQDGKIYTVVFGLTVILAGMIVFLVRLDKKIFILEKFIKVYVGFL